ncbi:2Fe-2S iron-sulfur cluster-binding protein [Capnocytophaga sp. oral taxon 878]|uniref:2Fe-2S iron-sulfur cluster-binding protein n=1 Tax=Capnocytophaga sp. oral taxon 878 TaxID=1316596 RepID=UPI000D037230|nr:2Fe-2S iron-sulfur cluster-binding protein [Capnocytophaga sp. oral taxon 878]AVM49492.1 ferredoxin [Capnocytophaga sp. oral taxon 878]
MNNIHLEITDREGLLYEIEAPTDMNMNLMEVMRAYEIAQDGEIGICGGMAMCASCQCYVQNEEEVVLPKMGDEEQAMLSEAFYVKPNSRLGCQIPVTSQIDGLKVVLAPLS